MKTYTIKTPTAELLIVELPRVCDYELRNDMIWIYDFESQDISTKITEIKGSYALLGKPDEIREEDARELVESKPIFGEEYRGMYHVYPKESKLFTASSVLSLLSLLETEIYWDVNPIGNEPELEAICCGNLLSDAWGHPQCCGVPNATEESIELHSMWHEAEQKTFNRNRSIIFKKNSNENISR